MAHRDSEEEKLAEEIAGILQALYEEGKDDESGLEPSHPLALSIADLSTKDIARQFITRIGQAYADGEMKFPEEVDRWYPGGKLNLEEWINEVICVARPDVFIALRKEEE